MAKARSHRLHVFLAQPGKGDKNAADDAAVQAMRSVLGSIAFDGASTRKAGCWIPTFFFFRQAASLSAKARKTTRLCCSSARSSEMEARPKVRILHPPTNIPVLHLSHHLSGHCRGPTRRNICVRARAIRRDCCDCDGGTRLAVRPRPGLLHGQIGSGCVPSYRIVSTKSTYPPSVEQAQQQPM